jgi:hypothetical protein
MSTTTVTRTIHVQKRSPIGKWSGSDEPQSYYWREDNDTITLTADERRRIQWYCVNAHAEWHNTDDD